MSSLLLSQQMPNLNSSPFWMILYTTSMSSGREVRAQRNIRLTTSYTSNIHSASIEYLRTHREINSLLWLLLARSSCFVLAVERTPIHYPSQWLHLFLCDLSSNWTALYIYGATPAFSLWEIEGQQQTKASFLRPQPFLIVWRRLYVWGITGSEANFALHSCLTPRKHPASGRKN